jgi:GNAT superfamily N-acetyltransferase
MSILQPFLAPFVREYWIGRTFVHRVGYTPASSCSGILSGCELIMLTSDDVKAMRCSADPELRGRSALIGPEIRRFGARVNGELVGVCTFRFGRSYFTSGGFYDLDQADAELTDAFTSLRHRGRGIARALIRFSADRMHDEGFRTLYAKVWHSNHASSHAFRAAGWKESCFFVRLYPRGTKTIWHLEWRHP